MSVTIESEQERRQKGVRKLIRAVCALANLVCWSAYASVLRTSSAGYSPRAIMYGGLTIGIVAATAWLVSVRVGATVQSIILAAMIAVVVFT